MDGTGSIGLVVAFTAGLLSFLSPCVLPLIPSYITFITGMSLDEVRRSRGTVLVHSLLFILGFTLIFVVFGIAHTKCTFWIRRCEATFGERALISVSMSACSA